jgi:hypothetical protein
MNRKGLVFIVVATVIVLCAVGYAMLKRPPQREQADRLITSTNKEDILLGLSVYTFHGTKDDVKKIVPFLDHSDQNIQLGAMQALRLTAGIQDFPSRAAPVPETMRMLKEELAKRGFIQDLEPPARGDGRPAPQP